MTFIPVVNLDVIRQRLGQTDRPAPFVLHEFRTHNAPLLPECRMEVYFIALLHEGEIQVKSDLVAHTLQAPALFAMAPAVMRKFVQGSRNFRSEVIFFEKAFFLQPLSDATFLDKYPCFYERDHHLLPLDAPTYQDLCGHLDLIRKQAARPTQYSSDIVRNVLHIILLEIATLPTAPPAEAGYSHNRLIYSVFRQNLEKHFLTERRVSFYAYAQHLSSKYFSGVIQQQTGKTASELIDERVLLEARALLQNKELTISQIAAMLNFEDASYFGKYFKNLAGTSPLNYRHAVAG